MKHTLKRLLCLSLALCLLLSAIPAFALDIDSYPWTTYLENGDGTAYLTCYIDHPYFDSFIEDTYMGMPVTAVGQESIHRVYDPYTDDFFLQGEYRPATVYFPESITTLRSQIIANDTSKAVLHFPADAPTFKNDTFLNKYVTVYYPASNKTWDTVAGRFYGAKNVSWKPFCGTHNYVDGVCTHCGDGCSHNYVDGPITQEFTCASLGMQLRSCSKCAYKEYMTLQSAHNYIDGICKTCGATCNHVLIMGVCEICGVTCSHDKYVDGFCVYCGTEEPSNAVAPTLSLRYPTVSFEDEILLNVYFDADNLEDTTEIGLLMSSSKPEPWNVFTVDKVLRSYVFDEEAQLYRIQSEGIPAKNIGDTVYIGLYAKLKDGTYVYTAATAYSPKSYALSQLNTGNTAMKQLMVAMLNYGAAAQTYFSHNTDNLVNAGLTTEQLALVEGYRSDMMTAVKDPSAEKQGAFVHTDNITLRYRTVSFEGAFSVNYYCNFATAPVGPVTMYYWTDADYEAAQTLSVDNATAAISMEDVGGGQYRATVSGIAAKDLDRGFYVAFSYSDGSTQYFTDLQTYSIGAYCNSTVGKNISASPLAAATAVYGYYAKQMFN